MSTKPFIPHETQTNVIGQTARMLRLFYEHICRLNLICVADMNNETLMKVLADMNNAALTGRLRYHIFSNNYHNCACHFVYVVLSTKKLDNNFAFHNSLTYFD